MRTRALRSWTDDRESIVVLDDGQMVQGKMNANVRRQTRGTDEMPETYVLRGPARHSRCHAIVTTVYCRRIALRMLTQWLTFRCSLTAYMVELGTVLVRPGNGLLFDDRGLGDQPVCN